MAYDIIFVSGEMFFDHPLCGIAILKRLLEQKGYSVGVIEMPKTEEDIKKLGKPRLFFGVSSGSIDSMVRNYTPLKKPRKGLPRNEYVPDRAVIVYSNWIRRFFKETPIVLGGTEATLRRFVHYDYWDNKLRKPILFDSRADILAYGSAEKQIIEIAERIKNKDVLSSQRSPRGENRIILDSDCATARALARSELNTYKNKKSLDNVPGTCIISKKVPVDFNELPSYDDVSKSKELFCDMQNMFDNRINLAQKIDNRYVLQYKSPTYTSKDIDSYYEFPFTRKIPAQHLSGFDFSIVTHRGCIGECNFCSLKLTQGNRIISRPEESILREIKRITQLPDFKGNIDDLGGPSVNMYRMDCDRCNKSCIDCEKLDRSNKRLIELLRKARAIKGIKNIFIRSGIRYDLAAPEYLKEVVKYHISGTLKIAPEHVNKNVLRLMNKDKGNLQRFIDLFKATKTKANLSYYFMTAHPGSAMKEAKELADSIKHLKNAESVQVFTPTPMTVSTCMYYTGMNPKTKKNVYVPYAYSEKKMQKRAIFNKRKVFSALRVKAISRCSSRV